MSIFLPVNDGDKYSNSSQKIRVITENWIKNNDNIFCPQCGSVLENFENNRPVADFFCKNCSEEYELKSKNGNIGRKIVDGAYETMIERLNSLNNPNFFFLTYNKVDFQITNFMGVPRSFFTPTIIEKRKALSENAKRAGWIGCNILLNEIPDIGKIFFINQGKFVEKEIVLENWRKTNFLKNTLDYDLKGWILDILNCIDKLKKTEFELEDIYKFEVVFKRKYPLNNNIKAKIRQQLQFLRDKGLIEFLGKGKYKIKYRGNYCE